MRFAKTRTENYIHNNWMLIYCIYLNMFAVKLCYPVLKLSLTLAFVDFILSLMDYTTKTNFYTDVGGTVGYKNRATQVAKCLLTGVNVKYIVCFQDVIASCSVRRGSSDVTAD